MFEILFPKCINSGTVFLIFAILMAAPVSAEEKIIRVGADPWCPYNCAPNLKHQGLMVDIASEALALSGYTLKYDIINWARAKRMVKQGELDAIVGMSRSPTSEPYYLFPDTALGQSQVCFYRMKGSNWEYKTIESMKLQTLGWINDYGFSNDGLDLWVKNHKQTGKIVNVAGVDVYSRLFKLIQVGRITTFAEDKNVIAFELKKAKVEDKIEVAGCLDSIDDVHLVFSLQAKDNKKWAKALDDGVDSLRQNGRLDSILSYYGLTFESWLK